MALTFTPVLLQPCFIMAPVVLIKLNVREGILGQPSTAALSTPKMVNQKAFTATYQPEKMLPSLRGFPLPGSEVTTPTNRKPNTDFILISTQN